MSMTLGEMAAEVEVVNRSKGWYDEYLTFGDLVALLHSEVSEMLEAYRRWELADATRLRDTGGTRIYGAIKPEGVGSEMADVLIRLLDMSHRYHMDLEYEYHRKMAYNRTRPYRHGGKNL